MFDTGGARCTAHGAAARSRLEKPVGEDEDSALADFVEDATAESPFEVASTSLRRESVSAGARDAPRAGA